MWDVELYTVILNPLNTILTLDWTMHLHNAGRRNSPKFNEIQCIVCAGKLVFLTMHSFSFIFKTLLKLIYFDLIFLNIAWVFWIYFYSLCNCARVVVSWLNLYDKVGIWVGRDYSGVGARRDPGLIAHARPLHLLIQSRAVEFPWSGYLLAFFLLIAHKTCILIAGLICISFLQNLHFLTLQWLKPLKTYLWSIWKNPAN